jgi:ferritin
MAAYFESINRPGMAGWMRVQVAEEQEHEFKFFDFVKDHGGRVKLAAIDSPPLEWASPLAAFLAAYQHEQKVTGMIDGLVRLADSEGDGETHACLQCVVGEQAEEEKSASDIVEKLKGVEDTPDGLSALDRELGQRKA